MRVLALVTLPTLGAGNRLRIEQYAGPLRAHGIDLTVSAFFDDAAYEVLYRPGHWFQKLRGVLRGVGIRVLDLARAPRFDLILIYRESAPIGPPLFERALGLLRIPFVFDFDDAIFLGPIHPVNRRWAWLRNSSRVIEAVRRARAVIAGNDYLRDWAMQHNERVDVITTPVDTERHRPADRSAQPETSELVLGWVGSSTTAPYLHLLDDVLEGLAPTRDVVVRVVGGEYCHPRVRVEVRPYDLESEAAEIQRFTIGLLPQPDDAWTQGKGAFKALLYMAAGIPVLASRVGVNPTVVVDGVTGYCVSDVSEWVERLDQLARNPELRSRLGAAGRERVERLYSLRVLTPRLAQVLMRAKTTS